MKFFRCACRAMMWFAVAPLCVPAPTALAHEPLPFATTPAAAKHQSIVRDIALAPGGLIIGQVLDANYRPVPHTDVANVAANATVATTRTDANGVFAVSGLRGGVHHILTPQGSEICRLWAPGTAPPCADGGLQIRPTRLIVRGQGGGHYADEPMFPRLEAIATHPLVVGGLLAAAIAIPAALHNADEPPGS